VPRTPFLCPPVLVHSHLFWTRWVSIHAGSEASQFPELALSLQAVAGVQLGRLSLGALWTRISSVRARQLIFPAGSGQPLHASSRMISSQRSAPHLAPMPRRRCRCIQAFDRSRSSCMSCNHTCLRHGWQEWACTFSHH
jgi:hypothetical protein